MFDGMEHDGTVVRADASSVEVEIISSSACGDCHAKAVCGMGDARSRIVEVPSDPYETYIPGEKVKVCMRRSMGLKAVWLAYTIPLMVLVIFILGLSRAGVGELWTAIGAIASVALYYFIIFLCRDRLANECVFKLKKL